MNGSDAPVKGLRLSGEQMRLLFSAVANEADRIGKDFHIHLWYAKPDTRRRNRHALRLAEMYASPGGGTEITERESHQIPGPMTELAVAGVNPEALVGRDYARISVSAGLKGHEETYEQYADWEALAKRLRIDRMVSVTTKVDEDLLVVFTKLAKARNRTCSEQMRLTIEEWTRDQVLMAATVIASRKHWRKRAGSKNR